VSKRTRLDEIIEKWEGAPALRAVALLEAFRHGVEIGVRATLAAGPGSVLNLDALKPAPAESCGVPNHPALPHWPCTPGYATRRKGSAERRVATGCQCPAHRLVGVCCHVWPERRTGPRDRRTDEWTPLRHPTPPPLPRFEHTGRFEIPRMGVDWFVGTYGQPTQWGFDDRAWILRKVEP
jgi:hypothetical protein